MRAEFDKYDQTYKDLVNESIAFAGVDVDFVTAAKARQLQTILADRFVDPLTCSALDVGCGVGSIHPYIDGSVGRLVGVDISDSCLEIARKTNSGVDYQAYDGVRLPFEDASFDLVYTICVMHHVPPLARAAFVAEMNRVTAPGGMAVVIEHNPYNPLTQVAVNRCEFDKNAVLYSARMIRSLFAATSFEQVRSKYFLFLPFSGGVSEWVDGQLGFIPLGAQFFVSAKKPATDPSRDGDG